jgi:hypothetical protein
VLWEDRVDGPAHEHDQAGSITTNASVVNGDAVFVAGVTTIVAPFERGRLIRAYALATGRLIWEARHAVGDPPERPFSIAAEGNGVFTAGSVSVNGSMPYSVVRAYDRRTGRDLWHHFGPSGPSGAESSVWGITVKNGRVFVTGRISNGNGTAEYTVRAYEAATGVLLWQDRHGPAGSATSVKAEAGRVFVLGTESTPISHILQHWVRVYDARSGTLLWQDRPSARPDGPVGLTTLDVAGSRVFAGGWTWSGGLLLRAYDVATGHLLWETVRVVPGEMWCGWTSVAAQKSRVFVAGCVAPEDWLEVGNYADFFAAGYDAMTGRPLWEERLDSGNLDEAAAVVAAGDRVFVSGFLGDGVGDEVTGATNTDFFVRAYDAQSGRVEWSDRIDTGSNDAAIALATQGDRVFAAGVLSTNVLDTYNGDFFVRAYEGR